MKGRFACFVGVLSICAVLSTFTFLSGQLLSTERLHESIMLDERVGLYLDRSENEALGIFKVENFIRAKFFRTAYDSLFAVIYYSTDSGIDSLVRYITPFDEFLIRVKLKEIAGFTQKRKEWIPLMELNRYMFPEFASIQIFTRSGEEFNARFLSFKRGYLGVAVDSNFRKMPVYEINRIVYFNPEVKFKMLQRNFIIVSSLLSMVSFDILRQLYGDSSKDKWLMRTAGLFTGFYASYRLYEVIDMNFLKKEIYILCPNGLVIVKKSFLRRFVESVSQRLRKCHGLRLL
ncbi:MAG: hypothetical protein DRP92_02255 [Candidatus Neomarinimicrobiota bacterium]|nr:MAG: hypothetical protein DRP92_02255 [Candidatus Neomarinimicrobiota bacterium]